MENSLGNIQEMCTKSLLDILHPFHSVKHTRNCLLLRCHACYFLSLSNLQDFMNKTRSVVNQCCRGNWTLID